MKREDTEIKMARAGCGSKSDGTLFILRAELRVNPQDFWEL